MKPKVLIFTGCYLPGFHGGGPIRTISSMVERLSDFFEFKIFTSDRDLNDEAAYTSVKVDEWNKVGMADVFYASPSRQSFKEIVKFLQKTPCDLVYINSFFNTTFSTKPLIARKLRLAPQIPYVLAPRGEFSEGALSIKGWKKWPFITVTKLLGLYNVIWHASTAIEGRDIQKITNCHSSKVKVARNLTLAEAIKHDPENSPSNQALRICFLSRVAPIKNLKFALGILSQAKTDIYFGIYGPIEDKNYWAECEDAIKKLPKNVEAQYLGSVDNVHVKITIADYDILFVPTLGENFGHVFQESLLAGTPILLSDQTPWRDLEEKGIGWDLPLEEPDRFLLAVDVASRRTPAQRSEIRRLCIDYAIDKSQDAEAICMNNQLFSFALNSKS